MSDHVPFELQIEVMIWLPVKSLIRFRSVSKTWKSLINSSKFIADYTKLHSQRQHHLLIKCMNHSSYTLQNCFVSIVDDDDDTFAEHKLILTIPNSEELELVGSSHGLFCFVDQFCSYFTDIPMKAVICNPSLSKSVTIYVRNSNVYNYYFLAFGVCGSTLEPKIIKIYKIDENLEVEVFTLSLKEWRKPLSNININIMLRKNVSITSPKNVVIDGLIYWLAARETKRERYNMIVSFDLTSEEFIEIQLPDELKLSYQIDLRIFKLRESVAVVQPNLMTWENVCEVWKMEINGVKRSFTKLFNIEIPADLSVGDLCGFTKNGQLLLKKDIIIKNGSGDLVAFDLWTKSIKNLGIIGRLDSFDVTWYSESLLLLDNSELTIYGRRNIF